MNSEGYIKIYRKILDNPIVCKDADHFAVWMYLLLKATHKEMPALFKGEKIILKSGQLITGRKSISEQLKISESKIFRIINCFKIEQQIKQQTSNKNSLITILNWEEYQQSEQQNKQQVNNKRTTSEQQVNTNNNVNNVNNVISYIYGQNDQDYKTKFEQFYSQYPRKVKKQEVLKWFNKNKPSDELFKTIIESLEKFKVSKEWLKNDGQFVPYPSTWLNQKRWEDEIQTEEQSWEERWLNGDE